MRRMLFAAVAMLMLARPGAAADFTFNVPVSIHNMPAPVTNLTVSVLLFDATWGHDNYIDQSHLVGFGSASPVPLQNGGFDGTVTLSVTTYIGQRHPQEAVYYRVYFVLHTVADAKRVGSCDAAFNQTADYPLDLGRPCLMSYDGSLSEASAPGGMPSTGQTPNQPAKPPAPKTPPVFHLLAPPPH